MARSESKADSESNETMSQFKEKVSGFSKRKILKLLFSLMDECEAISTEYYMLKDTCSKLKRDIRMLENTIQKLEQENKILTSEKNEKAFALSKNLDTLKELERVNEILKCENFEAEKKNLALGNDLNALKNFMNTREKEFNTDLAKLKSESVDLKLRLESLVSEKTNCLKRLIRLNLTSFKTGIGTVPQKHMLIRSNLTMFTTGAETVPQKRLIG